MIVKHLIVFSVMLAVACAANFWTVPKIIAAISNPTTDNTMQQELSESLVTLSTQLIWGHAHFEDATFNLAVYSAPGSIGTYTRDQIKAAISNSRISPFFKPHFQNALDDPSNQNVDSIEVNLPALELLYLKKEELDVLISRTTDEQLKAYYQAARKQLETANRFRIVKIDRIVVAVPFDITGSGGWGSLTPGGGASVDAESVIPIPVRTPRPSVR